MFSGVRDLPLESIYSLRRLKRQSVVRKNLFRLKIKITSSNNRRSNKRTSWTFDLDLLIWLLVAKICDQGKYISKKNFSKILQWAYRQWAACRPRCCERNRILSWKKGIGRQIDNFRDSTALAFLQLKILS